MKIKLEPLHTLIIESKKIGDLIVVMEEYKGFPEKESNIYALDNDGLIKWFAEKPSENDAFLGTIKWNQTPLIDEFKRIIGFKVKRKEFSVSTWNGFLCSFDVETGKIIKTIFTK